MQITTEKFDAFIKAGRELPINHKTCDMEQFDIFKKFELPDIDHDAIFKFKSYSTKYLRQLEDSVIDEIDINVLNAPLELLSKYFYLIEIEVTRTLTYFGDRIPPVDEWRKTRMAIPKPFPLNQEDFIKWDLIFEFYLKLEGCITCFNRVYVHIGRKKTEIAKLQSVLVTEKRHLTAKNESFEKSDIALICHYKGILITRSNALTIAKEYGHSKAGRLYQDFLFYMSHANRTGFAELSKTQLKNKKNRMLKVIKHLEGKAKEKAEDDYALLNQDF